MARVAYPPTIISKSDGRAKANVLPADTPLETALGRLAAQTAFTITSTREPHMPIMFVSREFCKMTGYEEKEILGRNCRFLQGPGTSRQSVQEIRNCIQEDRGCTVCLLNYTKDGKPFWNQLCLAPIRDEAGVACYLGIQTNVTGAVLAYRSQQYSPFQPQSAGPHGGVHSFTCPEIVAKEMEDAKKLESTIRRWHSEKFESVTATPADYRPVSSKSLPASLLAPLYKLQQSYILSDPNLPDMPIVHASEGFLRLTGRPRNQVIGHNCRFMQGPLTNQVDLQRLRDAIREERPLTVRLLNYRANGQMFWNNLHVAPIRDADGKVVFYVGCQLDITLKDAKSEQKQTSGETGTILIEATSNKPTANQAASNQPISSQSNASLETIPETEIARETLSSVANDTGPGAQVTLEQETKQRQLLDALQGDHAPSKDIILRKADPHGTVSKSDGEKATTNGKSNINIEITETNGNGLGHENGKVNNLASPQSRRLPEAKQLLSPASKRQQQSVIGAVRVVCRSLSTKTGLRRSLEDQHLPHGMDDCGKAHQPLKMRDEDSAALRIDMPNLNSSHL